MVTLAGGRGHPPGLRNAILFLEIVEDLQQDTLAVQQHWPWVLSPNLPPRGHPPSVWHPDLAPWPLGTNPTPSYPPQTQFPRTANWGRLNGLTFASKQHAILLPSVTSASFTFCKEGINLHGLLAFSGLLIEGRGGQDPGLSLSSGVPAPRPPLGPVSAGAAGKGEAG